LSDKLVPEEREGEVVVVRMGHVLLEYSVLLLVRQAAHWSKGHVEEGAYIFCLSVHAW
jgi:hypothetical protein